MGLLSHFLRVLLIIAPLTQLAAHARGADVLTTTAELNRCLSAARIALARRGALDTTTSTHAARLPIRAADRS